MRAVVRSGALFLLPTALLASPVAAAVLAVPVVVLSSRRRRVSVATRAVGLVLAGLLAAANAYAFDLVGVRSSALLAGPFGNWALWLVAAVVLAVVYASLSPADARIVASGSACAAIAAATLAGYQVIALGDGQALLLSFHPNVGAAGLIATLGGVLVGFGRVWRSGWRGGALVIVGLASGLVALSLTGSRSGLLGAAAGTVVLLLLLLPRLRWRPAALTILALAVVGVGAWYLDRMLRGPPSENLVTNSGFEYRLLPWRLAAGSHGVSVADDSSALALGRTTPTHWLANYLGGLAVPRDGLGAPTRATLSLAVLPGPRSTVITREDVAADPVLPVVIVLDALDADGAVVARLGVDGWLEDPSANLQTVGGRPRLPTEPVGAWQRFVVAVPPAPATADSLRLEFQPGSGALGEYGLLDDVMLAATSTATYVPGQRPGLFTFLTPATSRLQLLRQPFAAAGGRIGMWALGLDLAAARPILGYGPGSEAALAEEYAAERVRRPLEHFHSLYLRLLLEGGALLLASVLVLFGYVLVGGVREVVKRAPGSAAVVATTVALLVQSVFDPVLAFGGVIGGLLLVAAVAGIGAHRNVPMGPMDATG